MFVVEIGLYLRNSPCRLRAVFFAILRRYREWFVHRGRVLNFLWNKMPRYFSFVVILICVFSNLMYSSCRGRVRRFRTFVLSSFIVKRDRCNQLAVSVSVLAIFVAMLSRVPWQTIAVSSANCRIVDSLSVGCLMSWTAKLKRIGDNAAPCGTPAIARCQSDLWLLIRMRKVRSCINE